MPFSSIHLSQFRNYAQLKLDFVPGINCLTGNNGEGKTNVLEAIHYLCMTRGWQARSESYALREGDTFFLCEGRWEEEGQPPLRIQCNYLPAKGKKVIVGGRVLPRMSDHIGRIPVVAVLPNDTELIYGSPGGRRRFMDAFISQYDPQYLQALIHWDKALQQRNALLLAFSEQGRWDPEQLALWDRQMIPAGIRLHEGRRQFLQEYLPHFRRYFAEIVSDRETPEVELVSPLDTNTEEAWIDMLARARDRDRAAKRSTKGVHKEELAFTIDGQPVRNYGSQGQQKTFLVSLKLAQYQLLLDRTGKPPVLLLDDIFDKLDAHRLKAIADILDQLGGQVFVTDTSYERSLGVFGRQGDRPRKYFAVQGGKVKPLQGDG